MESFDGTKKSDHGIVRAVYSLQIKRHVKWINYYAREKTDKGKELFKQRLFLQNWEEIYTQTDPSIAAKELDSILGGIMDECFPLKKYRKKASDPPWMTHGLRKKISQRKGIYAVIKRGVRDGRE